MTKEELEKATGQELIEQRNYCGVDGYYGDYLDDVNAEMLKRFNRLEELETQIEKTKCCSNCKNCRRKFIKKNVFEHTCKVEHCKNYDKWEMKEI